MEKSAQSLVDLYIKDVRELARGRRKAQDQKSGETYVENMYIETYL